MFNLSPELRIAGIYGLVGIAWILLSDQLVGVLLPGDFWRLLAQSAKGVFFIGFTTLLVWRLVRRFAREEAVIREGLAEQKELMTRLLYRTHDLVCIYTVEANDAFRILDFNEHYVQANADFGRPFDPETVKGLRVDEFADLLRFPPDFKSFWLRRCRDARDQRQEQIFHGQLEFPDSRRGPMYIESVMIPIPHPRGAQITHLVEVIRDVTPARLAEEERLRLYRAIEQVEDGIVILDHTGRILYANRGFAQMSHYVADELTGRRFRELFVFDPDGAEYRALVHSLRTRGNWRGRRSLRDRQGSAFLVECSIVESLQPEARGRSGYVMFLQDVTERAANEERQRQAHLFQEMGIVASGIAHDFGGLLGTILLNSELMSEDLEQNGANHSIPENLRQSLQQIVLAARRGRDIVRGFLSLGKFDPDRKSDVDLREIAEETVALFPALTGSAGTVRLIRDYDRLAGPVSGDPVLLHRLLLNLITNSLNAIEERSAAEGGTGTARELRVGVVSLLLDDVRLNPYQLPAGAYVRLMVADTGVGIDPAIRARIFDPFFSTRRKQGGTGVGLAQVQSIVAHHGGVLRLESEIGQGTRFEILLPESTAATPPFRESPPGEARILLVNYDRGALLATRGSLETHGYRTQGAHNAADALAIWNAEPQITVLVVLSWLPDLSGAELITEACRLRPAARAVLLSAALPPEQLRDNPRYQVLARPLERRDLIAAIEQWLPPGPAAAPHSDKSG